MIIFDEIQECPEALTSLKYFYEHTPEYFVATAGSLLGVKLGGAHGFPVGKIHFCHLYPLSFFEFLDAIDRPMLRNLLENTVSWESLAIPHHEQCIDLLKTYFIVGGMPKVVLRYVETQDFHTIRETQEDIVKSYIHDFAKHAPSSMVMKITQIWDSIPIHLGKENKKFMFSAVKKSARARDYEEALQWLLDAGLIYKVKEITTPKLPLASYNDQEAFKIYLFDVGLLAAVCRLSPRVILEGDQLFVEFKGSFTENYVTQSLIASGSSHLYYWTSSREAEVDFVVEHEGQLFPLEVKSGISTKNKSLFIYQKKYHPLSLARSNLANLSYNGKIYNYPLYLICRFPVLHSQPTTVKL
ncbi:MAG: ATP-binding protein [Chlamydiae bacterium]|nr:ATP-binding protein [Chlamydiota bacterium]